MVTLQNKYTLAGYCFYASSALHVLAIILSAGALFSIFFVPVILWAAVGYGLINKGWRWLAYLGFIGALVGIVASTATALDYFGLTRVSVFAITFADIGAAYFLFRALWQTPAPA